MCTITWFSGSQTLAQHCLTVLQQRYSPQRRKCLHIRLVFHLDFSKWFVRVLFLGETVYTHMNVHRSATTDSLCYSLYRFKFSFNRLHFQFVSQQTLPCAFRTLGIRDESHGIIYDMFVSLFSSQIPAKCKHDFFFCFCNLLFYDREKKVIRL